MEATIVKTHEKHIQQDKYQSHQNNAISLVYMETTYITSIQIIVLQSLQHTHESVMAQKFYDLSKSSKIHQYNEYH